MKKLFLVFPFLVLAACGPGIGVNMETARDLDRSGADVVPRVQTSAALRAFDKYCERNSADAGRVVAALKKDGYRLLVTSKRDKMFGYVHPNRPFVAVIDNNFQPGCMVMVKRDPAVAGAFDRFVNQRHRGAVDAGRSRGLDRTWLVTGKGRDRIYSRTLDGTDEVLLLFIR